MFPEIAQTAFFLLSKLTKATRAIKTMRFQGKISILIAIPLVFALFLSTAFANTCLCGQLCTHSLQTGSRANNFHIHLRCANDQCRSCDLEDGQTVKAPNPTICPHSLENLEVWIFPSPFQTLFRYNVPQGYSPVEKPFTLEHFFPIYLQNLTIIV